MFARFCDLSNALKVSAESNGTKLMWNETLGFLGTCPSNLGTGLRASVMVKLEEFNKLLEGSNQEDKELLEEVCSRFDLQPRGSAGEHSAAVGAKFDVSNKQRLGFSEVQLVQKMIDGVSKVIELEEQLARKLKTPAQIRAELGLSGHAVGSSTAEEVKQVETSSKHKHSSKHGSSSSSSSDSDPNLSYGGHYNLSDPKNTDGFTYMQFDQVPQFTSKHRSAMAKHLTPAVFDRLKHTQSKFGYSLSNAIQTGVVTPHLGVGATAGDEDCWEVFKDLYYPIIRDWHGYDANTQKHPVDLDPSKLVLSDAQRVKLNTYVSSTRIRAARNISGFPLPAGATPVDRAGVEGVLKQAFSGLGGELAGTYFELGGLSDERRDLLLSKGFLFQVPTARNLLTGAGAARSWPDNRGIFHNEAETALAWVNEEDHCRIISSESIQPSVY